jgi:alpha-tubulin suppressor-like RCC1 family protein
MKTTSVRAYSLFLLTVLSLLALLAGCGGGGSSADAGSSTATATLKSIVVTPANSVVAVGTTKQFTATGTYSDGKSSAISTGVTWSAAGNNATIVFTSGLVTGKTVGTETITATVDGVKGSTTLLVKAPWVAVSAGGSHTVARKADGSIVAWGWNRSGQLGDGSTIDKFTPTPVSGGATTWTMIAAGEFHTVALRSDGTLWAWGFNQNGQLGDGTTTDRSIPVKIGTASNWAAVAAGKAHTMAVKTDGTLWTWGRNFSGQLGDGTTVDKLIPTKVTITGVLAKDVAAGESHSVMRTTAGKVYAWGGNDAGQVGNGATTNAPAPVEVSGANVYVSIAAGGQHTLAIRQDGALFGWGDNEFGQVGIEADTNDNVLAPTRVGKDSDWATITGGGLHSMAIRTDGTLWTWGANADGQLGDGTLSGNALPKKLGQDNNWTGVSGGKAHSYALKGDGSMWRWGRNLEGQLGTGSTSANQLTPVSQL